MAAQSLPALHEASKLLKAICKGYPAIYHDTRVRDVREQLREAIKKEEETRPKFPA